MIWPSATTLETARFLLEPLTPEHAEEMIDVLAPEVLYAFTGGQPPTNDELRAQYVRQSVGQSPAGDEGWLNWVIRTKASKRAVGYVQATLTRRDGVLVAEMAWLITPAAQGGGAATEAATAVLTWVRAHQVRRVRALIHPDHHASVRVAQHLGFEPTSDLIDGELVWEAENEDPTARTPPGR